ncbi:unnamed protein product [Didymodactylos carnosus]|nr:unnamed protein product [Didymodactylos carnosus]CAF4293518.1 unnamed protein product [Didymodactylos carnosus]
MEFCHNNMSLFTYSLTDQHVYHGNKCVTIGSLKFGFDTHTMYTISCDDQRENIATFIYNENEKKLKWIGPDKREWCLFDVGQQLIAGITCGGRYTAEPTFYPLADQ